MQGGRVLFGLNTQEADELPPGRQAIAVDRHGRVGAKLAESVLDDLALALQPPPRGGGLVERLQGER